MIQKLMKLSVYEVLYQVKSIQDITYNLCSASRFNVQRHNRGIVNHMSINE